MKLPLLLLLSSLLLHQTFAGEYDASLGRAKTKIYHPSTSSCVLRRSIVDPLKLGSCSMSDSWYYTPQKLLTVKGTYFCLQAAGSGQPVRLSIICSPSDSSWQVRHSSSSKKMTQLSTMLFDGTTVCLDSDPDGIVVSNPCMDLDMAKDDEDNQWFMIVTGGYQKVNAM